MLAIKPVSELRSPSLPEVRIRLDGMIPPSVNNYVRHSRNGSHYKIKAADAFALTVQVLAKGSVDAKALRLEVNVYLGKGKKGDGDNFFKVIADSLVTARIIKSDAHITQWYLEKHRDREHPRTEIYVSAAT